MLMPHSQNHSSHKFYSFVIKHVLHEWGEGEKEENILKNCVRSVAAATAAAFEGLAIGVRLKIQFATKKRLLCVCMFVDEASRDSSRFTYSNSFLIEESGERGNTLKRNEFNRFVCALEATLSCSKAIQGAWREHGERRGSIRPENEL